MISILQLPSKRKITLKLWRYKDTQVTRLINNMWRSTFMIFLIMTFFCSGPLNVIVINNFCCIIIFSFVFYAVHYERIMQFVVDGRSVTLYVKTFRFQVWDLHSAQTATFPSYAFKFPTCHPLSYDYLTGRCLQCRLLTRSKAREWTVK